MNVESLYGIAERNLRALQLGRLKRRTVEAEIKALAETHGQSVHQFAKAVVVEGEEGPFIVNLQHRGLVVRIDVVHTAPGHEPLPGQPAGERGYVITSVQESAIQ